MCGRYTLTRRPRELADHFGIASPPELPFRYNVAPTQAVSCVRLTDGGRALALLRWGLVPHWADSPAGGAKHINARAETVAVKPSYRDAFRKRRCLIAADGFYEWQAEGKHKQPWYFRLAEDRPFAFAGLWELWQRGDEPAVASCCLLTTEANDLVRPVHERMPVILPPEAYASWLDPTAAAKDLQAWLRPYEAAAMTGHPVGKAVNNPRHDAPDCVAPLA